MFKPYNPCDHCPQPKSMCEKCGYQAAQINYQRALKKIAELSSKLGEPMTILVTGDSNKSFYDDLALEQREQM